MSKTNKHLILVTGATGKQGGAVLRHLREKGFPVRALTRDPDKPEARALIGRGTEVVRGDLDDRTSLARALDGVYGVQAPWDKFEQQAGQEMTVMVKWFEDFGYHADIPALRQQHQCLMSFERWMNLKLRPAAIGVRH